MPFRVSAAASVNWGTSKSPPPMPPSGEILPTQAPLTTRVVFPTLYPFHALEQAASGTNSSEGEQP